MSSHTDRMAPLRDFVIAMTQQVEQTQDEATLLPRARALLSTLIAKDDWLPEACAVPRSDRYAQYLLHCDPLERFSVLSFVWGPGQRTPVHDHTVWGLVGVLRGREQCEEYALSGSGPVPTGHSHVCNPGDIDTVSPTLGDWHVVRNPLHEGVSISIHVYGANIGALRRHRVDAQSRVVEFISGYDSALVPNLWDRSSSSVTTRVMGSALPAGGTGS